MKVVVISRMIRLGKKRVNQNYNKINQISSKWR